MIKPSLLQFFCEFSKGLMGVTARQTQQLIERTTQKTGEAVNNITNNWLVRKLAGFLNLNWLIGISDQVDLSKAAAATKKLQQSHPNESPRQIAHRIMVEKATRAGGIGLATSVLPGFATALLAVDLVATTQLQSEMVYQIAAAYGLDLQEPARKGEVLAIFGLGLGGGRLLRLAGLSLLENVPFVGAAISASSNATMIYSLGYAACRFYEAKLDASKSMSSQDTITQLQQQSENYLQQAIAQQAIMDQILVHLILAKYPDKTWQEILPELQALHFSPKSLDAIAQNFQSPLPLDTLINQLNSDFVVPLLAQCQKIAHSSNKVTTEEERIIAAIATKVGQEAKKSI